MLKLHKKLRNNDLYYYNIDYYYNFMSGDKTSFLIRLYDNNDNCNGYVCEKNIYKQDDIKSSIIQYILGV